MTSRRRIRALALAACAAWLSACSAAAYGAQFGYPNAPPAPPGATVVAHANGSDDDDPMRGREIVIDIRTTRAELVGFYKERFPSADGWLTGTPDPDVGGGHLLCRVNHADRRFDEYVEIYPAARGSTSAARHRYLVSISRLYPVTDRSKRTVDRCGLAGIWFPTEL